MEESQGESVGGDSESLILIQSYFRSSVCRMLLESLDHLHRKRYFILQELLETEENYLKGINQLIEDIYGPLMKNLGTENQILNKNQIDEVFPLNCIEIIKLLNTDFRDSLAGRLNKFTPHTIVGDIFLKFSDSLRIYTVYVEKYDHITEVLNEVGKLDNFRKFMNSVFGIVDPTMLEGLLVTPIQRVPRYQLLLQQLHKYTWNTHPDFQNIEQSLERMKNTAMHINEKSKETISFRKLLAVQSLITGMKNEIIDPQRKFVKEGVLYQLIKGKWKSRYFFLFNDRLIRTKESSDKGTYSFLDKVNLRQVEINRTIKFSSSKKEGETNSKKKKIIENSFMIKHPHPIEFIVSAESAEEKEDWINKLNANIHQCQVNFEFYREEKRKVSTAKAKKKRENILEKNIVQIC